MILIIDDERSFMNSYVEALEDAQYAVILIDNINEALEYFNKHKSEINLIIIDIMFSLPTITPKGFVKKNANGGLRAGVGIIRLLNESYDGSSTPKIILTNVSDKEFHSKYRKSNLVMGCYLKKVVRVGKLVSIVNSLLK